MSFHSTMEGNEWPLPQLIRHRAETTPDDVYLESVDGPSLTYGMFHRKAAGWAGALARSGLVCGQRVAILSEDQLEATALWVGLAWIRAVGVPIHRVQGYHGNVLERILADTESVLLVISASFIDRLDGVDVHSTKLRTIVVLGTTAAKPFANVRTVGVEEFLRAVSDPLPVGPTGSDMAAITYTSGSSGPPKGAVVYWTQIVAGTRREWLGEPDRIEGQYKFYWPIPMTWAPSFRGLYWIAFVGGTLVIRDGLDPAYFLADIDEYQCSGAFVSAGLMRYLLQQSEDCRKPPSLKFVTIAGAVPDCVDEFKSLLDVTACTAYGMTELPSYFIGSRGFTVDRSYAGGCCGYARSDIELRIVDGSDEPVPEGHVGELIVRSSRPWMITTEYVAMPDATAAAWRNGWFHTGDAFSRDEQGRYYFFERMADVITRNGKPISSTRIETALCDHPDVIMAAVAVPDDAADRCHLRAFVVLRGPQADASPDLNVFLASRLPGFLLPDSIEFLRELPRTPTGKIDRPALRRGSVTNAERSPPWQG